jgi:hypothetical protein
LRKSDHLDGPDVKTQTTALLFHPRRDNWAEHFSIVAGTGEIAGLSPVGRVTVTRLQLNTPTQLAARQQWMRLRLFP